MAKNIIPGATLATGLAVQLEEVMNMGGGEVKESSLTIYQDCELYDGIIINTNHKSCRWISLVFLQFFISDSLESFKFLSWITSSNLLVVVFDFLPGLSGACLQGLKISPNWFIFGSETFVWPKVETFEF